MNILLKNKKEKEKHERPHQTHDKITSHTYAKKKKNS